MNLFENLGLGSQLLEAIRRQGFETPTMIQERSMPHVLAGKDVIGESATGSGKTLAFGCGIVKTVQPRQGVQALVLAPTRELAEQIKNDLLKLTRELRVITIYGGVSMGPQVDGLRTAEVVVATPGRMIDHLQHGTIDLSRVKVLVLDEVDRMFDMGFIEHVERIIDVCPKQRQTLFFSATVTEKIREMSTVHMNDPVEIMATRMVDPSKLKQVYYDVHKGLKMSLLAHLLKQERAGLVMVFCNTRRMTDVVAKSLKAERIDAIPIHGGLSQNKRTKTIGMFNKGRVSVLVCTDVAARGLHVDHVSHVYNYDIPKEAKDYVHRIGRTARAGEDGMAVNLLCEYDYENFGRIQSDYTEFNIKPLEKPYIQRIRTAYPREMQRRGPGRFNRFERRR